MERLVEKRVFLGLEGLFVGEHLVELLDIGGVLRNVNMFVFLL
jgi:hypothetical protein